MSKLETVVTSICNSYFLHLLKYCPFSVALLDASVNVSLVAILVFNHILVTKSPFLVIGTVALPPKAGIPLKVCSIASHAKLVCLL